MKFYVYGFFCVEWKEYFYIGKGSGKRIHNNNRSEHIQSIIKNHTVKRHILYDGLDEVTAYEVEAKLKEKLKERGSPIIDYENKGCYVNLMKARQSARVKRKKPLDDNFKQYYRKYMGREINKVEFAKLIKVSRPTLDRMIKDYCGG